MFGTILKILLSTPLVFAQVADRDLLNLFNQLKQTEPNIIRAYQNIKLPEAWNFLDKASINFTTPKVGIVDTGVDLTHQEFRGVHIASVINEEGIQEDFDLWGLRGGHGTQVAGIIGANNISAISSANFVFPHIEWGSKRSK